MILWLPNFERNKDFLFLKGHNGQCRTPYHPDLHLKRQIPCLQQAHKNGYADGKYFKYLTFASFLLLLLLSNDGAKIVFKLKIELKKDYIWFVPKNGPLNEHYPYTGWQSQLYSIYKSNTTWRALIGCDPNGSVIFESELFTGRDGVIELNICNWV